MTTICLSSACRRTRTGAELVFEVFSQRHERGSTLVTSNLPFDEWTRVYGLERLTGALLDRPTHHGRILEMNGDSYRLNQSKRSRRASAATPAENPRKPDAWRKGPSYRPFLPASLIYFWDCSP
jgi:hypothetical protein